MTELLMSLLNLKTANHEDRLLREQLEVRDRQIAQLEQKVALQDVEIERRGADFAALKVHGDTLLAHIDELKSHMDSLQKRGDTLQIRSDTLQIRSDALQLRVDELQAELDERVAALTAHAGNIQAAFGKEFENQKVYIVRLEADLKGKDQHILYLERLLQGVESGRVFRLTRALARFLGR
jgi:chaperonin cofactor prefoldin